MATRRTVILPPSAPATEERIVALAPARGSGRALAFAYLRGPLRGGAGRVPVRGAQHVLAAVVADGVEPALRVERGAQVAVRHHDALLVVQGPGDHLAVERLADGGAAAAEDLLALGKRHGEVVRERARRDVLRHRHDERARLDRDVAHAREP